MGHYDTLDVSAFQCRNAAHILVRRSAHASDGVKRAVWKKQVRSLPLCTESKLREKVTYIRNNPVRRNLVEHPEEWPYSSWRFYEGDGRSLLPIQPWVV